MALALASPIMVPLLLFGGLFLKIDTIPDYFAWLSYISWFMYGNEAISISQWSGVEFTSPTCNYIGDYFSLLTSNTTTVNEIAECRNVFSSIVDSFKNDIPCNGDDLLEFLGFHKVLIKLICHQVKAASKGKS